MKIKGVEKFMEKVPALAGKRIFFLPVYGFSILLTSISVLLRIDALPEELGSSGSRMFLSLLPFLGELLVCVAGLVLV